MAKKEEGAPAWMMTFGDAMSLLLTFFVMLISFTDFDKQKLSEFLGILRGAFNIEQDVLAQVTVYAMEDGVERPVLLSADDISVISANIPGVRQMFADLLRDELSRAVYLRLTDEGMAVVIQAAMLFEPHTANLLPGNERIFKGIGNLVAMLENEARITAVVPADTDFLPRYGRTAWGFSAYRGQAFIKELASVGNQSADRFSLGIKVLGARERGVARDGDEARDYVEILLVERRQVREVVPEEVVIRDHWL